jgi:hypothetical protein
MQAIAESVVMIPPLVRMLGSKEMKLRAINAAIGPNISQVAKNTSTASSRAKTITARRAR